MPRSLRDLGALRIIVGNEDITGYIDEGITYSNIDPGGFEAASFQLPRDMPQTLRGQPVRVDSGLRVAWEGRVSQIQRSLGHRTTINCEGYGALLKDFASSQIFIDRDLTRWRPWAIGRQVALLTAGYNISQFSAQVGPDKTNLLPALVIAATGQLIGAKIIEEAWYDSGPQNTVARVRINSGQALGYTFPDAANVLQFASAADDSGGSLATDTNIAGASPSRDWTLPTARRFAIIQHTYTPPGGAALNSGVTYGYDLENLTAIGNHGLTLRGSPPTDGFYPSDIFTWALTQAPGLTPGTIMATDASGYIVPHSAYYTPVTLDQIINDMALAQGWHWGIWESPSALTGAATPRADFRPRPSPGAFTAFCRRSDCDTLDLREDLANQYNAATVAYTDVAGNPGAVTVTAANPILDQAGIASRTVVFQGGTMTAATATVFGQLALTLTNQQARIVGSANIISPIDASGPMPAWLLKAGIDRLRIGDLPSVDAWGSQSDFPISRVETSISSNGMNTAVELGTGAHLVEMLQARLAAATFLAGQGG